MQAPDKKCILFFVTLVTAIAFTTTLAWATDFAFDKTYVDLNYGGNGAPGWVRAGDMDGDGDLDIVAGGGYALFIYENDGNSSGWTRYGNLDSTGQMGANGAALFDVDRDGDLDVVSAKYYSNLGWWENPGGTLKTTPWSFHQLDNVGSNYFAHDVMLADLDQDGQSEEIVFNLIQNPNSGGNLRIEWVRPGANPQQLWEKHSIETGRFHGSNNHAGLDTGDVDKDGNVDIAYSNGWYEAPDDPTGTWIWRPSAVVSNISNALLRDMDNDSDLDLICSAGHYGTGVYWFENPADPKIGSWTQHTIDGSIVNPEGLAAMDLDADGDIEVVACDLDFNNWNQQVHNVYVFENSGDSITWVKQNIAPNSYASHKLQAVDINKDGKADIISEGCGYKIISYYENTSNTPPVIPPGPISFDFTLETVDGSYPGNGRPGWSASGDIDGDGATDVVSGGGYAIQWYEAPAWTRHAIEASSSAGGNGGLVFDVDVDGDLDVVAGLYMSDLVWWENPGSGSVTGTWNRHVIDGVISKFNHDLAYGDVDGDGKGEVVALYVDGGVWWYDVPANPAGTTWPRTRILASISDPYVGLALGDIDGDGDTDVVASNKWYERPANPSSPDWTGRTVFSTDVQNVFVYDVNRDGRLDVVAAEGFKYPNGRVLWAEAPSDPKNQAWTEHLIAGGLDGPENIWAGDLDGDGNTDIVSGEMGTSNGFGDSGSNFIVYEGLSVTGTTWSTHVVAENVGVSARINPVDIESDGDIDFTADGNAENHIYLWVKDGGDIGNNSPPAAPTGLRIVIVGP